MKKWRRTALSVFLICVAGLASSSKSSSQNPTPAKQPAPRLETLEDYANLYNKNIEKEADREYSLFKYTPARNILTKYNLEDFQHIKLFHDDFYPTEDEMKIVGDAYLRTLKKALKETRKDSPDIQQFEDEVIDILKGYYLSLRGSKANGHTGIPTLDEERRQESIERESKFKVIEKKFKYLGNRYRVVLGGEFNYDLKGTSLSQIIQGAGTEASLYDFKILGQNFHSAKFKTDASQKLELNITKILNDKWYVIGAIKYDCFPGNFDYALLSFMREKPNSKFTIGAGQFEKDIRLYAYLDKRF